MLPTQVVDERLTRLCKVVYAVINQTASVSSTLRELLPAATSESVAELVALGAPALDGSRRMPSSGSGGSGLSTDRPEVELGS